MYEYHGRVTRVVDGDTLWVDLDLGCDVHLNLSLRLAGINAPEIRTSEGPAAKAYLESLFLGLAWVVVRTVKDKREKYGRYLAIVVLPDGRLVNDLLLAAGHAVPYGGGAR